MNCAPSLVRTVISADFDNDGYDEIFFNNIGQPNRMFRMRDGGVIEPVPLSAALEADGLAPVLLWLISTMMVFWICSSHMVAPQPLSFSR